MMLGTCTMHRAQEAELTSRGHRPPTCRQLASYLALADWLAHTTQTFNTQEP